MALGHQHAFHFAQHLVRVGVELQRVRHHHQIDAVGGKRQVVQIGAHLGHAVIAPIVAAKAQGHAVGAQEIVSGQGQLHGVETENIGHQKIVLLLLPIKYILAGWRVQPVFETLN